MRSNQLLYVHVSCLVLLSFGIAKSGGLHCENVADDLQYQRFRSHRARVEDRIYHLSGRLLLQEQRIRAIQEACRCPCLSTAMYLELSEMPGMLTQAFQGYRTQRSACAQAVQLHHLLIYTDLDRATGDRVEQSRRIWRVSSQFVEISVLAEKGDRLCEDREIS